MPSRDTEQPRTGIVVQARLGSTRLPGKVLLELTGGDTVLGFLLKRLSLCRRADCVVVATTDRSRDDALAAWLEERNIPFFRGSEDDCLDRFLKTCKTFDIDVAVRVTSDCPLADPGVIDSMLDYYLANARFVDYLSNRQFTNYPEGLDAEIFTIEMLGTAAREAIETRDREHINFFFLDRPDRFRIRYFNHNLGTDLSRFSLSIDTKKNLDRLAAFIKAANITERTTFGELAAALQSSVFGDHHEQ